MAKVAIPAPVSCRPETLYHNSSDGDTVAAFKVVADQHTDAKKRSGRDNKKIDQFLVAR